MRYGFLISSLLLLFVFIGVLPASSFAQQAGADGLPSVTVTKEQIDAAKTVYDSMTPAQKAALAETVKKQAAQITPEQKAALIKRAREHFASLSPQERAALKTRLLELGSRLSASERAAYMSELGE